MRYVNLKTMVLLLLVSGSYETAAAQEYRHTLENSTDTTIELAIGQSDVVIEGHDSNEVVIRNLDYEEPPERAKGLKALYYSATDNTGIGLSVEEENGTLKIIPASKDDGDYRLLIPDRARILLEEVNWGGGDYEFRNLRGEIEVLSKNADIRMLNVTGPVIASSTSGDVEIDFSSLNQSSPTSITLVSGFIDIAVPADTKADLKLSSVSGEVYTDLNIDLRGKMDKENMRRIGGSRLIEGTLNGGGVEVGLKSVSGDIYLREKGE